SPAPPNPAAPNPTRANTASCPILILSAMPLEAAPIFAAADVNPNPVWVDNGRGFWSGVVEGNQAIIALTGIGLSNATQTTQAAFNHFPCFSAVVFSGTSGGDFIGDVMVPSRWTQDGKQFVDTSAAALGVLNRALQQPIALEQSTPTGDPLCACGTVGLPSATIPVTLLHVPKVEVGGDALSNDGFGGRTLPCTPEASDVLGCWPCKFPDTAAFTQGTNLATTVPPFLDPSFFLGYPSASAAPPGTFVSQDMETAAVFAIAAAKNVPFIGFRAASDGGGDPLMLPGFPSEFFVYRQLAADNAAAVALAFLRAWHASHG
ncbi:MAG TPA: hypothetical protein VFV02_16275, partial [Acidimicrobiales bacterium]|nr:hypothetical protein [Acidimicrobiales bacterium]